MNVSSIALSLLPSPQSTESSSDSISTAQTLERSAERRFDDEICVQLASPDDSHSVVNLRTEFNDVRYPMMAPEDGISGSVSVCHFSVWRNHLTEKESKLSRRRASARVNG